MVSPPGSLYRVGHRPDPWVLSPNWSPGTKTENRFDDPIREFRVVYCASSELACFLEVLADFRHPDAQIETELGQVEGTESEPLSLGTVPASWLNKRAVGNSVAPTCRCAPVLDSSWLSFLRRELELQTGPFKEPFDLAVLFSQDRSLTQRASRIVFESGLDGIRYASRHGADLTNWALFYPARFELGEPDNQEFNEHHGPFHEAMSLLDLTYDSSC